jgi:hypothetical protein
MLAGPRVFFSANDDSVGIELWAVGSALAAADAEVATAVGRSISGMLSASGANGDLTFSIVANGRKGTATITNPSSGAFTYVPALGATGTDRFTFRVSDAEHNSNVATVTVTIEGYARFLAALRR